MGNNSSTPLEGPVAVDDSFLTDDTRNNRSNSNSNSHNVSAVGTTTTTTTGSGGSASANYNKYKAFPGSTILEKTFCGSIDTTDPSEYEDVTLANRLLKRADILCVSSPDGSESTQHQSDCNGGFNANDPRDHHHHDRDRDRHRHRHSPRQPLPALPIHPSSAMLARALVSEVTDNPKTMTPADMTAREKKLLLAQAAANRKGGVRVGMPVGAPGGVGPPAVLNSLAYALTGDDTPPNLCVVPGQGGNQHQHQHQHQHSENNHHASDKATSNFNHMMPAGPMQESRNTNVAGGGGNIDRSNGSQAVAVGQHQNMNVNGGFNPNNPHAVTIGLSLSRRSLEAGVGHDKTVTRQTAFDFDELQDRAYKYVSSTDASGWRAAGGERGGPASATTSSNAGGAVSDNSLDTPTPANGSDTAAAAAQAAEKQPFADTVHIPIIHLDCPDAATVDQVIAALASGEIFIPHMAVLPEALSVSGNSPPDLCVRFGCERNEDLPADEWPNWCLEFMHNQLYEYFYSAGAKWNQRPFSITLAKQVRWKTVKHMNRYFAHAERVIDAWREQGPQYLDPELSYIAGGATPEEVATPHGIYLFRNNTAGAGAPTNYFCPNFEPPYTTKMTRSLLSNVLNKSWDKKRREWTAQPIPKLVTPANLMAAACGCSDPASGGFMASEVTSKGGTPVPKGPAVPKHVQKLVAKMEHVEVGRSEAHLSNTSEGSNTNSLMEDSMDGRDDIEEDDDDDDDGNHKAGAGGAKVKMAMEEEKKTDEGEASQQRGGPKASRNVNSKNLSRSNRSTASDGQSMAMSGTTVMHNNTTSNRLFSDEDWDETSDLNELDTQKEWTRQNAPGNKNSNEDNDGELRQKVAAEQSKHTQNLQAAQSLLDREKAKAYSKQGDSPGAYRKHQGVETSESLEYSTDGSSAFFREDGSGAGNQQYTSNAATSKASREEDDGSLSIQDSSSSVMSVVPSDEELFAVGWAKALDPGSGNFYYFTLDRSMTVWDNPLSHSK